MTHPSGLPDFKLCFNRAMRRSQNRLRQLYDEVLAPHGICSHEFGILSAIALAGSVGIVELADVFLIDRATLRYRMAPLEKAGLVAIVPDRRDKRTRRIELTADGERKLAEAKGSWEVAQARFEAIVGTDAAKHLRDVANQVASPGFVEAFRA